MKRRRLNYLVIGIWVLFFFVWLSCSSVNLPAQLSSPDGNVVLQFNLTGQGEPVYRIVYKNNPILKDSRLGFEFVNSEPLSQNLQVKDLETTAHRDAYSMVYGTEDPIKDEYNEMTVSLTSQGDSQQKVDLVFRAYDEGVAFRTILKQLDTADRVDISKEKTEFNFAADDSAYTLNLGSFTTNYETNYTKVSLSSVGADAIIGLPMLVETANGLFVAITEANLTDYAGMYLSGVADNSTTLTSVLSPLPDGGEVCVKGALPLQTPWRVIMVSDHPGRLIESNIILNLNEPCAIDDPSWIKPGKTAWDWWANQTVMGVNFDGGMNTATMEHYIDFAGEAGIEYMLIDAEWYGNHRDPNEDITTPIPEIDMPDILQHAKSKNVDVILWVNWQCVMRQMDEAFPLYEKWGVKGIKVDYMNRDDQEMVNHYHEIVKKAAEHQLIVDFHGAYKPTGIRRTYPNLITREGVLGQEYSKWSYKCSPEHDVTIPFIRMLAGPMDFTPGAFRTATRETFNPKVIPPVAQGTRCHQLAMYVVYESPLQMCVDYPGAYRGETGLEFLKAVPTTWSATKVIKAKVADYITIARKNGNNWYVGSMTDWSPRQLEIPLTFLDDGDFVAEIYSDGPDADRIPNSVATSKVIVTKTDTVVANLAAGGGQAMRLFPAQQSTSLPRLAPK